MGQVHCQGDDDDDDGDVQTGSSLGFLFFIQDVHCIAYIL